MKQILIVIIFLLFTTLLSAQKAKLYIANQAFEKENYTTCIRLYLEILNKKDITEAKINLAESYRKISNWTEAEYWYGQIVHSLPNVLPVHLLNYGKALQANGKCDLAVEYFTEYLNLVPDDLRGQLLKQACYQEKRESIIPLCKGCYEIQPLPFNSELDDYSPTIYKNQLAFASNNNNFDTRPEGLNFNTPETYLRTTPIDTLDHINYEYLYDSSPNLFFPKTIGLIGASTFLNNNEICYTKTFTEKDEILYFNIIKGKLINNEWQFINDFPFNSDEYSVLHPTFTPSGDTIYFASNMPGGFGGIDLYYSVSKNGNWSKPINLGSTVNTAGYECFPFYHALSKKLYFSSDGHLPNKGGFDIYYTLIGFEDENVLHLDSPINSPSNDHGLTLNKIGTFGYFSSNRVGGIGGDDIYSFQVKQVNYQIIVVDEVTLEPIKNATIEAMLSSNFPSYELRTNAFGKVYIPLGLDNCKTFKISAQGYTTKESEICTFEKQPNSNAEVWILLSK